MNNQITAPSAKLSTEDKETMKKLLRLHIISEMQQDVPVDCIVFNLRKTGAAFCEIFTPAEVFDMAYAIIGEK